MRNFLKVHRTPVLFQVYLGILTKQCGIIMCVFGAGDLVCLGEGQIEMKAISQIPKFWLLKF